MIDISYLDLYFNEEARLEQRDVFGDKYTDMCREVRRFVRVFLSEFWEVVGKEKLLDVTSNKYMTVKEHFFELCNYCDVKCSDDYFELMKSVGKEYSNGAKLVLKEVFGENINKKRSL